MGKDIWAYDGYPSSTSRLHIVEENETLQALFSPPKVHADMHAHKRYKDFYQDKNKKKLKRDKNLSLYNNILLFLIIEIYVNLFLVLGENMSFSLHFYFIYMLKNIIRKGGSFQCGNSIKTCYQLNNWINV